MEEISNLPKLLFLCGFMGAGKSTIGRELSANLDLPFKDLDDIIEEQTDHSIPQIFEAEGEAHFRSLERKFLLDTIRNFEGILSLGGGTLQNQHLVDHIKINGLLIFIETPFSVIFNRITKDTDRPLLLNEDGTMKDKDVLEEELKGLYNKRLKFYEQAEITIQPDTTASARENTAALVKKIRNHVSYN